MSIVPAECRATALHTGVARSYVVHLMPVEIGGISGLRWQDEYGRPLSVLKTIFHTVDDGVAAARKNGRFRAVLRIGMKCAA